VLTPQGMSHIVIAVPGFLVVQTSYVRLTYVVRDPWTVLSRGWNLWFHCGGKMRIATSLCLYYSTACTDTCKSWLSSNRTTGPSFEGLACAMECSTYLTKWCPAFYSDGCTLCSVCWLYPVLNVLAVPCGQWQCWWGPFYVSLSYPVAVYCQNSKMNLKILPRAPCCPSMFPHRSHTSCVLLLSDLFLQVRII
jgi:hypothetical protein